MKTCSIDGCTRPFSAKGYCKLHYRRWYKHGNPLVVLPRGTREASPTCKYGHILTGPNLRITRKRRGNYADGRPRFVLERVCRPCHNIHTLESRERARSGRSFGRVA